MSKEVLLILPWPPSVNHYWGNRVAGKRVIRYITAKGKEFRANVAQVVKKTTEGSGWAADALLYCRIEAYPPDNRKRDLDNLLKAPLDALEHARLYNDDNQIQDLSIKRLSKKNKGELHVYIGE